MKTAILRVVLVAIGELFVCQASAKLPPLDGYPIANFALTVNASANGDLYGQILQNPGKLGEWLEAKGAVSFSVEKSGKRHPLSGFAHKQVERSFPFVRSTYSGSPVTAANISVETFCPLGVNDAQTSSLPALLLEVTCSNSGKQPEAFSVVASPERLFAASAPRPYSAAGISGVGNGQCMITSNGALTRRSNGELLLPVSLAASEQKTLRVLLTFYDEDWVSAGSFASVEELSAFVHSMWQPLKAKTGLFEAAIPQTDDRELNSYLRWYMVPGVALTKYTKNDEALTMGYIELNQRDSYWTSWLHLVLFRDLEQKMIDESAAWQQPSGKIPTTILPLIEREDDLDINAFFILRAARFYRYYHDRRWLAACMPALAKAMSWLQSRDTEGTGLPVQASFWGDWKDVQGVKDRKYSPFSAFVYLAALRQMELLSLALSDSTAAQQYAAAYQKGYTLANKPTGEGGLWNGSYYCQRWKDGSVNDRLLQDQAIGVFFDVVPRERALKVIGSLNAKSLTPYGIAETTPYYDASWGYAPGAYHNGAVWPWLSFMDCWARIRTGKTEEAIALVKRVATADLVASGDWSPNEHISSLTGENLGFQLQGWNAGLFGLVYFGLLYPDILP